MNLSVLVVWLARALAILGGVVLAVITVLTVVSIGGRAFIWAGLRPIPGDFELVEAGMGFAIFAFLPWCQLRRGHATVDLFTSLFPARVNRVIDLVTELLMTAVIVLIAWRLWYGMQDKIRYNETTFILQFPVWWGYAAAMAAACQGVVGWV
jgi:TRAP-type C4-dicarboxylate transport system permease small subunit